MTHNHLGYICCREILLRPYLEIGHIHKNDYFSPIILSYLHYQLSPFATSNKLYAKARALILYCIVYCVCIFGISKNVKIFIQRKYIFP